MGTGSSLLQFFPGESALHQADSLSKTIWMFMVTFGVYFIMPPQYGFVLMLLLVVTARIFACMPFGVFVKSASIIFFLGGLLFIFHSIIQPGREIFSLGALTVTDCGIAKGLHYFFTMSCVVMVSLIFTWTTDVRDLMAGLIRIGFPYPIAFAVYLMFRFLPLMKQEIEVVRNAHAIRGMAKKTDLGHRFYLWRRYIFTILVNGLRKAEQTSIATECRGFGSIARRTELREHRWSKSGILLMVLWGGLILTFLWLQKTTMDVCIGPSVII